MFQFINVGALHSQCDILWGRTLSQYPDCLSGYFKKDYFVLLIIYPPMNSAEKVGPDSEFLPSAVHEEMAGLHDKMCKSVLTPEGIKLGDQKHFQQWLASTSASLAVKCLYVFWSGHDNQWVNARRLCCLGCKQQCKFWIPFSELRSVPSIADDGVTMMMLILTILMREMPTSTRRPNASMENILQRSSRIWRGGQLFNMLSLQLQMVNSAEIWTSVIPLYYVNLVFSWCCRIFHAFIINKGSISYRNTVT